MLNFDTACEKLSGDISWLAAKWLPIRQMFICDATCTLGGDVDLERAYRRVCELKEKIEYIRDARAATTKMEICTECGVNYADFPSRLCPGCEAYMEHCA